MSSLSKNGYQVIFEDGKFIMQDRDNGIFLVTIGTLENGLFVLDKYDEHINAHAIEIETKAIFDAKLWHARFGHLNYGSLLMLQKHNMV